MPKIRTLTVNYTIDSNQHKIDVNIMYDVEKAIFYVVPPKHFYEAIDTMSDELRTTHHIRHAQGIRGVYGHIIADSSESILANDISFLFHCCGNACKKIRNVIIVWCTGTDSSDKDVYHRTQKSNKEEKEISLKLKFILAVETKIGEGTPVYTQQNVPWKNTISISGYREAGLVIDDTPENRLFLEDVYSKFDSLIVNLQKFFATPDDLLQLIASNQKLLQ